MSNAIWLIMYDIASANEAAYLDWFHNVHIPEKLARPGYTWGAHYEVVGPDGAPRMLTGNEAGGQRGFAAFFGGEDTRTFLDPSPAQIKPTQPPLTREMMGHRIGSQMMIATEEWRALAESGDGPSYANLNVVVGTVDGHDEDYGSWCIQTYLPYISTKSGFEVSAKFLSTTAPGNHVMVASFATLSDAVDHRPESLKDAWSARVQDYQALSTNSPLTLRCISRSP
ncbi:MAG: hypothetical protein AAGB04_27215 [Pseudomonadota bacterium]